MLNHAHKDTSQSINNLSKSFLSYADVVQNKDMKLAASVKLSSKQVVKDTVKVLGANLAEKNNRANNVIISGVGKAGAKDSGLRDKFFEICSKIEPQF